MAADTKRGAPEYVQIDLGGYHAPVSVRVDVLREQLAAQGLAVVTEAEAFPDDTKRGAVRAAVLECCRAELARREAAK